GPSTSGSQPSDGVVLTTSGTIGVVRGAVRHPRHFVLAPLTHLVVTERARAACVELIRLTGTAEPRLTGARFAGTELIRTTGSRFTGTELIRTTGSRSAGTELIRTTGSRFTGTELIRTTGSRFTGTQLIRTTGSRAAGTDLIRTTGSRFTGTELIRTTGSRFTGTELVRLTGVTGADIGSLLAQPLVQRLTLGLLGLGHAVPIGTRPAFRRLCAAFQRVRLHVVLIQLLAGRQRGLLIRCFRHVISPRRPGTALRNSAVCRGQAG